MRTLFRAFVVASIAGLFASAITSPRAQPADPAQAVDPAHDVQGNGRPVPPETPLPKLALTDAQRAQVSRAVSTDHTFISYDSNKAAASFEPTAGAALPSGVELNPLPRPLIYEIPILKEYTYVKFKNHVLIVDGLTRTIVDVLPEV